MTDDRLDEMLEEMKKRRKKEEEDRFKGFADGKL